MTHVNFFLLFLFVSDLLLFLESTRNENLAASWHEAGIKLDLECNQYQFLKSIFYLNLIQYLENHKSATLNVIMILIQRTYIQKKILYFSYPLPLPPLLSSIIHEKCPAINFHAVSVKNSQTAQKRAAHMST